MKEMPSSFDENELSEDDLAVLQAFDALENLETGETSATGEFEESGKSMVAGSGALDAPVASSDLLKDMFAIFASEADEDITTMWQALHQLEHEDEGQPQYPQPLNTPPLALRGLVTLQQAAHKLKGTAGAVGCNSMSSIARYIETLARGMKTGAVNYMTGLIALVHAVRALEVTLYGTIIEGRESSIPLKELETDFQALNIDIHALLAVQQTGMLSPRVGEGTLSGGAHPGDDKAQVSMRVQPLLPVPRTVSQPSVEEHPVTAAMLHTEQLVEQRASLETARAEVEVALQELHTAQARLRHLETLLFTIPLSLKISSSRFASSSGGMVEEERSPSSLVARILDEAAQRTGQHPAWGAGNSRRRSRHKRFQGMPSTRQFVPFVDELEMDSYTESDLLMRSLSEAIADVTTASSQVRQAFAELDRTLQEYMSRAEAVHSDLLLYLGLPQSHGVVQGLLVRAGNQRVVVRYSDVERIDYSGGSEQEDTLNQTSPTLSSLLGYSLSPSGRGPSNPHPAWGAGNRGTGNERPIYRARGAGEQEFRGTIRPLLIVQQGAVAVQVDEVLGEVELAMRPLAAHLQRPGIAGTAIDGKGNVLLVLDLPELLKQKMASQPASAAGPLHGQRKHPQSGARASRTILVADDSVYMRQSLLHTLSHAGYRVKEARDGMEALERLLEEPPDLLLLDIEMPKRNGYELLSIIRIYPELIGVKIVMLTSRSVGKYEQSALDLGAHAYLTKPCPQDVLLKTIEILLRG